MTTSESRGEWVSLPASTFHMGSTDFYPDEGPVRQVSVEGFQIRTTPVTNREFAAFVADTDYVTVAEQPAPIPGGPGSLVFTPTRGPVPLNDWRAWWRWVPGASWRHPKGVDAGPPAVAIPDHPVVQIAYADALAFAEWSSARLPTEAEHEFAAGGGRLPNPYSWGSTRDVDGQLMANTFRGEFPYLNRGANGWIGTSPVATFPANGFGLYDMIGNVWEWTTSYYDEPGEDQTGDEAGSDAHPAEAGTGCTCSPSAPDVHPSTDIHPSSGSENTRRVLKGGSHLCAPEYCLRYRPAARSPQTEDSATTHIGFRLVRDL